MIPRAAALAVAVAAIAAQPAGATVTVGVPGPANPTLFITADGADDSLRFAVDRQTSPVVYVLESRQPIVRSGTFCDPPTTTATGRASIRCRAADPTKVQVGLGAGADGWLDTRVSEPLSPNDPVTVNGGQGNDLIDGSIVPFQQTFNGDEGDDSLNGDSGSATLNGGSGNDRLDDGDDAGLGNQDTLNGGADNDTLLIREGNDIARADDGFDEIISFDRLEADEQPFGDQVDGGTGNDIYSLVRDRAVSIRAGAFVSNVFSDGLQEEVVLGIEAFKGTRGPDTINGSANTGTAGQFYDGRGGPDALVGTDRSDVLFGGDGSDRLLGRAGDDQFDAKDGEVVAVPDALIDCGAGSADEALIDLLDPEPLGCETVARSAIGERPHLVLGTVRRARRGAWAVRVRCPRALGHPCRGTLKLGSTRRTAARGRGTRYRIAAGRRRTLRVRLHGRARRRAFVRSVERGDVTGRKTTVGLRLLRRR